MRSYCLPLVVLLASVSLAPGQERADEAKKQLAHAQENMKQATLTGVATQETPDLIVISNIPPAKLKPIADQAQKAYLLAFKSLQFEEKEKLWPGKLTVYFFKDRDDYIKFMRKVQQERPTQEIVKASLRGNEPHVIVALPLNSKMTDAESQLEVAGGVAQALLKQKAGATMGTFDLPEWLSLGFNKNIVYRLDGQSSRMSAYRTKLRPYVGRGGKSGYLKCEDLWAAEHPADFETLATSLAEYFVFGPEAARLSKFLTAFRPSEGMDAPTTMNALDQLELKCDALTAAWKTWAAKPK